ncbi:MAG: hypothetical protein NTU53_09810 [Planctomycetota bacterium]|nr:hypothetical protein [Planctomycetota bacterium]
MKQGITRRDLLRSGVALAAMGLGSGFAAGFVRAAAGQGNAVEVINPQARVPMSFFIDDSTCLVNMGHFCMPQFAEASPTAKIYKKPWKTWPREIPDAFLREFGEFCAAHGVKGKFSIVPYPACVGWLDRELPGWSRQELAASLKLVRDLMLPNWDIHPEMISHTRVIDIRTGRPMAEINAGTMENSYPQGKKSVDELAAYMAYALRILKNCDLPCEGITTPGGFGNGVNDELSAATGQAVRDVFGAEIPHYFKYISDGNQSTRPKLEHVEAAGTQSPRVVVNVPAGTGDWFGNWDGDDEPQGPKYATDDATAGRMVELIERGEPAVMLCHWPGLYTHGTKKGFEQFKRVIRGLDGRYREKTIWMKIGEIARYWAAKELTRIERDGGRIGLAAPFACPRFTLRIRGGVAAGGGQPKLSLNGQVASMSEVVDLRGLTAGTWVRQREDLLVCFDLPKGRVLLGV